MGIEPPTYKKQGCYSTNVDLGGMVGVLDPGLLRGGNEAATGVSLSEAVSEMNMACADVKVLHNGSSGSTKTLVVGDARELLSSTATDLSSSLALTTDKQATLPSTVTVDSTISVLVNAAYTQQSQPRDPTLKTEKIPTHRKVRCKFPDCPNRARVSQHFGNFCNRHVIVAPCGFPGCRDKAVEHAAMCMKHLNLGKDALNKVLNTRTQNVPVCRTDGCFKNDQGRGYCRGHENLMMAIGRLPLHISKRRLNSAYTMCSYPECTKHSQRRHLCRTHGNLLIKQAQGLANQPGATESFKDILAKIEKDMRRCTRENCTKNSQRDRLCTTHYNEKQNLQMNGATPVTSHVGAAIVRRENGGPNWRVGAKDSTVQATGRTECQKLDCDVLPYAMESSVEYLNEVQDPTPGRKRRDCDPFLSRVSAGIVVGNDDCAQKQAVFASTRGTTCANAMCNRESYGCDYCDGCQRLFSFVVVPTHENLASSSGYPYEIGGGARFGGNTLRCRAANCGQEPVSGGLCASHCRTSGIGSMLVDQVNVNVQTQGQAWALAETTATTAQEVNQMNPTSSGRTKKYYCKIDGCGKQAQRQSFCKRHYRLHASVPPERSEPETKPSSCVTGPQHSVFSRPTIACHFLGCSQLARSGTSLCLTHAKATFCWQPGCENIVERGRFCGFHEFRNQCAYEGCMFSSEQHESGCMHHSNAPKCRHDFCDKFAVGSEMCRVHQRSCQNFPCVLCRLHALSPNRFETGVDAGIDNGIGTL
uniref:C2H2-type domain-containing protein n=1 Tax=Hyaloperonospora arabidopsidis (strain Emoy2) TaxID=559515 RepID=M4BQZ7_HYAAE